MLALRIEIPAQNHVMNATVADTVPVGEIIPLLIHAQPGEHWQLSTATAVLSPDKTLAEMGVTPGQRVILDKNTPVIPPLSILDSLRKTENTVALLPLFSTILALFFLPPLVMGSSTHSREESRVETELETTIGGYHPHLRWYPWDYEIPHSVLEISILCCGLLFALICSALSLQYRFYVLPAALIGFGVGAHINVLIGCVCAFILIWRSGKERIIALILVIFSFLNYHPGITLILALLILSYAGQISIIFSQIPLFSHAETPSLRSSSLRPSEQKNKKLNNAINRAHHSHQALVIACCLSIIVSIPQLLPWGDEPSPWIVATLVALSLTGLSARSCRPLHAGALILTTAWTLLWLGWNTPWGVVILLTLFIPLIPYQSPRIARVLDIVETLAFCAVIPLTLATTGVFEWVRGFGWS